MIRDRITLAVSLLLLASTLTACSSSAACGEDGAVDQAGCDGPTSALPEPTPEPTVGVDPLNPPPDIYPYLGEPGASFNARSLEERQPFCSWIRVQLIFYSDAYAGRSGRPEDRVAPVSIDNSPQEIISAVEGMSRLAFMLDDVYPYYAESIDMRQKILGCGYEVPLSSSVFQQDIQSLATYESGLPVEAYGNTHSIDVSLVSSFDGPFDSTDQNGNIVTSYSIDVFREDGGVYTGSDGSTSQTGNRTVSFIDGFWVWPKDGV